MNGGGRSSSRANGARVVEVAVEVGEADERGKPARVAGELAQGLRRGTDEARPQQQVLRRVAGDRQLGEEDEVSPGGARLVQALEDLFAVAVEIADGRVDLGESESHRF